jgi:6-phospho-beta-glucosidase
VLSLPELIEKCYRHQLFPVEFIQQLGLLPTEYLYFYYFTKAAISNTRNNGNSRGQAVAAMNVKLFKTLAAAKESELIAVYEDYLRERNASYFSIEATAGKKQEDRELYSEFSGYERIALLVLQALHSQEPRLIPLTTRNDNAIEDLDSNDAVELPCEVSRNGVKPVTAGRVPDQVRELLLQVKEYERLTVKACVERSQEAAMAALLKNPLVAKQDAARAVLAEYTQAFGAQMRLNGA